MRPSHPSELIRAEILRALNLPVDTLLRAGLARHTMRQSAAEVDVERYEPA